jgi:hypothetical protein
MTVLASLVLGAMLAGRPPIAPVVKVEPIAREMVKNFNAGRFKAATKDFSDDLASLATPEVLAEQKKGLDSSAGGFRSVSSVQEFRDAGFRVVYFVCKYERSSVAFRVTFDHFNRISSVVLNPLIKDPVDAALKGTAEHFLASFTAGKFDEATRSFNATMRTQLPATLLAQVSSNLTTRFGEWKSTTDVDQTLVNDLRVIVMMTQYEKSPVEVRLTFDAAGAVAGFQIGPKAAE